MRVARLRLPVALLAALVAAGCTGAGGDDSAEDFKGEQRKVAEVVEDLQTAGRSQNGGEVCRRLLSKELIDRITAGAPKGSNCESAVDDALEDADSYELEVKQVAIDGGKATVTVVAEAGDKDRSDVLTLVKVGADWKISALGS